MRIKLPVQVKVLPDGCTIETVQGNVPVLSAEFCAWAEKSFPTKEAAYEFLDNTTDRVFLSAFKKAMQVVAS